MHSGTKYFGGHSDLLCGVIVVKTIEEWGKVRLLHLIKATTARVRLLNIWISCFQTAR